jgi:hypothetical protein
MGENPDTLDLAPGQAVSAPRARPKVEAKGGHGPVEAKGGHGSGETKGGHGLGGHGGHGMREKRLLWMQSKMVLNIFEYFDRALFEITALCYVGY